MAFRMIYTRYSTDCNYFLFNMIKLCDKDHKRDKIRLDIWTWKLYDLNITVCVNFHRFECVCVIFHKTCNVAIYR